MLHKRNSRTRRLLMMPLALLLAALMTFSGLFSTLAYAGDTVVKTADADAQRGYASDLSAPQMESLDNFGGDSGPLKVEDFAISLEGSTVTFAYEGDRDDIEFTSPLEVDRSQIAGGYTIEYEYSPESPVESMMSGFSLIDGEGTTPTNPATDTDPAADTGANSPTDAGGDPDPVDGDPDPAGGGSGPVDGGSGPVDGGSEPQEGEGDDPEKTDASAGAAFIGAGFGVLVNRADLEEGEGLVEGSLFFSQEVIYGALGIKDGLQLFVELKAADKALAGAGHCTAYDEDALNILSGESANLIFTFTGFGKSYQAGGELWLPLPTVDGEVHETFYDIGSNALFSKDTRPRIEVEGGVSYYVVTLNELKTGSANMFSVSVSYPNGVTPDGESLLIAAKYVGTPEGGSKETVAAIDTPTIVSHADEDWTIVKTQTNVKSDASGEYWIVDYTIKIATNKKTGDYGRLYISYTMTDLIGVETTHAAHEGNFPGDGDAVQIVSAKLGKGDSATSLTVNDAKTSFAYAGSVQQETTEFTVQAKVKKSYFEAPYQYFVDEGVEYDPENPPKSVVTNTAQMEYVLPGVPLQTKDSSASDSFGSLQKEPGTATLTVEKYYGTAPNEKPLTLKNATEDKLFFARDDVVFFLVAEGTSEPIRTQGLSGNGNTAEYSFGISQTGTYKLYERIAKYSSLTYPADSAAKYDAGLDGYLIGTYLVELSDAVDADGSPIIKIYNVDGEKTEVSLASVTNPLVGLGSLTVTKHVHQNAAGQNNLFSGVSFELHAENPLTATGDYRIWTATNVQGTTTFASIPEGSYYLVEVIPQDAGVLPAQGYEQIGGTNKYVDPDTTITIVKDTAIDAEIVNPPARVTVTVPKAFISNLGEEAGGLSATFGLFTSNDDGAVTFKTLASSGGTAKVTFDLSEIPAGTTSLYLKEISTATGYGISDTVVTIPVAELSKNYAKEGGYSDPGSYQYQVEEGTYVNLSRFAELTINKIFKRTATDYPAPSGKVYFQLYAGDTLVTKDNYSKYVLNDKKSVGWDDAKGTFALSFDGKTMSKSLKLNLFAGDDANGIVYTVKESVDAAIGLLYFTDGDQKATLKPLKKEGEGYIPTTGETTFTNTAKNYLTVEKQDAVNEAKLKGMVFDLYKVVGGAYQKVDPATYKSVTASTGVVTIYGLEDGEYFVAETKEPTNYFLNPAYATKTDANPSKEFKAKGETPLSYVVKDYLLPDVTVTKVDDLGAAIEDIVFELYKDGVFIATATTGANGIATFTYVAPGEYTLKEKIDASKRLIQSTGDVTVSVSEVNCDVTYTIGDNPDTLISLDAAGKPVFKNYNLVSAEAIKVKDTMTSPGTLNLRMSGVEFKLYEYDKEPFNVDEATLVTFTAGAPAANGIVTYDVWGDGEETIIKSDAYGEIYLTGLNPLRTYWLVEQETAATQGYLISAPVKVAIKTPADGDAANVIENRIKHYKIRIFKNEFLDEDKDDLLGAGETPEPTDNLGGKFAVLTDKDDANKLAALAYKNWTEGGLEGDDLSEYNRILGTMVDNPLFIGMEEEIGGLRNTGLTGWLPEGTYYVVEYIPPVELGMLKPTMVNGMYDTVREVKTEGHENGSIIETEAFDNPYQKGPGEYSYSLAQIKILKLGMELGSYNQELEDRIVLALDNVEFDILHAGTANLLGLDAGTSFGVIQSGTERAEGYSGYGMSDIIIVHAPGTEAKDFIRGEQYINLVADREGDGHYYIDITLKERPIRDSNYVILNEGLTPITLKVPAQRGPGNTFIDDQKAATATDVFVDGDEKKRVKIIDAADRYILNELGMFEAEIVKYESNSVAKAANAANSERQTKMTVVYDLYKLTNGTYVRMESFTGMKSGPDGILKITNLPIGKYAVKEVTITDLNDGNNHYGSKISDYNLDESETHGGQKFAEFFEITSSRREVKQVKVVNPVKLQLIVQKGTANSQYATYKVKDAATFVLKMEGSTWSREATTGADGNALFTERLDDGTYTVEEKTFPGTAAVFKSDYIYKFTVTGGKIDTTKVYVKTNTDAEWLRITEAPANGTLGRSGRSITTTLEAGKAIAQQRFYYANPKTPDLTISKLVRVAKNGGDGYEDVPYNPTTHAGLTIKFKLEGIEGNDYSAVENTLNGATTTFTSLPVGKYRLTETSSGAFRLTTDTNTWEFEVKAYTEPYDKTTNFTLGNAYILETPTLTAGDASVKLEYGKDANKKITGKQTLTVTNTALDGALVIQKLDEYGKAVTGTDTTFKIEGKDDRGADFSLEVSMEKADRNGKLYVPNVPAGKYTVTELTTGSEMVVTKDKAKNVTVEAGKLAQAAFVSFNNPLLHEVRFQKWEQETKDGAQVGKGQITSEDILYPAAFELSVKVNGSYVVTKTDIKFGENDEINLGILPLGEYKLEETAYPLAFERLDNDGVKNPTIYFTVSHNTEGANDTIAVTLLEDSDTNPRGNTGDDNKPVWADAESGKVNGKPVTTLMMGNEASGFYIIIRKYSQEEYEKEEPKELLAGAEFHVELFKNNVALKNLTEYVTSTEEGPIVLGPYSRDAFDKIVVTETNAPGGYALDPYRYDVTQEMLTSGAAGQAHGYEFTFVFVNSLQKADPVPSIDKKITVTEKTPLVTEDYSGGPDSKIEGKYASLIGGNAQDVAFQYTIGDLYDPLNLNQMPLLNARVEDSGLTFYSNPAATDASAIDMTAAQKADSYTFTKVNVSAATYTGRDGKTYEAHVSLLLDSGKVMTTTDAGAATFELEGSVLSFTVLYGANKDDASAYTLNKQGDKAVGENFKPGEITVEGVLYERTRLYNKSEEILAVKNTAAEIFDYFKYSNTGGILTTMSQTDVVIMNTDSGVEAVPPITIEKFAPTDSELYPGEAYDYTIVLTNKSDTLDLVRPVVVDVLEDSMLSFVREGESIAYAYTSTDKKLAAPNVHFSGNKAIWLFEGEDDILGHGQSLTITVTVLLNPEIYSGVNYDNSAYATSLTRNPPLKSDDPSVKNGLGYTYTGDDSSDYYGSSDFTKDVADFIYAYIGGPYDGLDNNGVENKLIRATAVIHLNNGSEIGINKWILAPDRMIGPGDGVLELVDDYANTEEVKYRISVYVQNANPRDFSGVQVVDTLPHEGDEYIILEEKNRETEWKTQGVTSMFNGGKIKRIVLADATDPEGKEVDAKLVNIFYSDGTIGYGDGASSAWGKITWYPITDGIIPANAASIKVEIDGGNDKIFAGGDRIYIEYTMQFNELWQNADIHQNYYLDGYNSAAMNYKLVGDTWAPGDGLEAHKVGVRIIPQTIEVGDFVWIDANDDGIQDPDEKGVEGQTVKLHRLDNDGNIIPGSTQTTTTDPNGYYGFQVQPSVPGNAPMVYKIEFYASATYDLYDEGGVLDAAASSKNLSYVFTGKQFADAAKKHSDSDVKPSDGGLLGTTPAFVVDYVLYTDGPDKAWLDEDQLRYVQLQGGAWTTIDDFEGMNNLSIDAGMIGLSKVGDQVWLDNDYDGILTDADTMFKDVWVSLHEYDPDTGTVGDRVTNYFGEECRTQTDVNGYYEFGGLLPGDYIVVFENPDPAAYGFTKYPGVLYTQDGEQTNKVAPDAVSADNSLGNSIPFTLESEQFLRYLDAGLVELLAVGDYVWLDYDYDGLQQNEQKTGVNGVNVTLHKYVVEGDIEYTAYTPYALEKPVTVKGKTFTHYVVIGSQLTAPDAAGENGYYLFTDLYPGAYYVTFDIAAVNEALRAQNENVAYRFTKYDAADPVAQENNSDAKPGDTNPELGTTKDFWLPGEPAANDNTYLYVDAGLILLGGVGDTVWHDKNYDGIQNISADGEQGIQDVKVELFKLDENQSWVPATNYLGETMTTTTAADGTYWFADLLPGTYKVRFHQTTASDIFGFEYDSIFTSAHATGFTLDSNGVDEAADGTYIDTDAFVIDIAAATDISSGTLELVAPTDDAGKTGRYLMINETIDQGLYFPMGIGDTVWDDRDKNGTQTGERGVNRVRVELYLVNGDDVTLLDSTTTDFPRNVLGDALSDQELRDLNIMDRGFYLFRNLDPTQTYRVRFYPYNSNYEFTRRYAGANDAIDSNADRFGWSEDIFGIESLSYDLTIDAGMYDDSPDTDPPEETTTPTDTPTDTPSPTPITTIPIEEETPPADVPEVTPPPASGTPNPFLPISDEDVPYGALSQPTSSFLNIEDEEVAYGPINKTGELAIDFLIYVAAGAVIAAIGFLLLRKGKKKGEDGSAA